MLEFPMRRRPLVECCKQQGWTPHYLHQSPAEGETPVDLLVKELQDLRDAGRGDLAGCLLEVAAQQGVEDERLQPKSQGNGVEQQSSQSADVQAQDSEARQETTRVLEALRKVCRKAGVTPLRLTDSVGDAVEQACAKEMQAARQQGNHSLVIALGRKALRLGLDHPRIHSNLQRSERLLRRETLLEEVNALLQGKRSAKEKAEHMMLEALIDDPEFKLCRTLLNNRLRERLSRGKGDSFADELLDHRIGLEFNRRRLELLEQRRGVGSDRSVGSDQSADS